MDMLRNAIRHPYDQASTQVEQAGSEEAVAQGEDPEATDADAGMVCRAGKLLCFYFLRCRSRGGMGC